MTQFFIRSIISSKMEKGEKEYYCEMSGRNKKTRWLKENQIHDFSTHFKTYAKTKERYHLKPAEVSDYDNIQHDKNDLAIILKLSDFPKSGLQSAVQYHNQDFYIYSGQVLTYDEMKRAHPNQLLNFYENKIIVQNSLE